MGSTVLSRRAILAGFATFAAAGTLPRRVLGGTQPSGNGITGYQPNGFTVPAGETWEITGTVETPRNVVVYGTLRMRPGSTLRFVNVYEAGFVGGGMDPIASDVGLWVMGGGVLDAQGTPVQGWASGAAPAGALAGNELVMAPTAVGDLRCTSFVGQSIPLVHAPDGRTFAAEVANLTRDVRIEGTPGLRSHIYIRSTAPQQIRHVAIRYMGPRRGLNEVLGRYPLHFHHCHDGVRGTVIEGAVVRDSGSHAFVPHMSNGITFIDCVAYGVGADAYWWDMPERTDDTVFEHCAAFELAPPLGSSNHNLSGFLLGAGSNNAIRNCVVAANRGTKNAAGFSWPAPTTQFVWTFQNNIAHNNTNGTRVWQNGGSGTHVLEDFVGYRNTTYGVDHGAYRNDYRYERALCFGNSRGWVVHAYRRRSPDRLPRVPLRRPVREQPTPCRRPCRSCGRTACSTARSRLRNGAASPRTTTSSGAASSLRTSRSSRCMGPRSTACSEPTAPRSACVTTVLPCRSPRSPETFREKSAGDADDPRSVGRVSARAEREAGAG
jgi:hypothetical protein